MFHVLQFNIVLFFVFGIFFFLFWSYEDDYDTKKW